jgi:hypothetical protein
MGLAREVSVLGVPHMIVLLVAKSIQGLTHSITDSTI